MIKKIPYLIIVVAVLLACENNSVYEQSIEVSKGVWERNEVAKFEFPVKDTSEFYHLFITLRNSGEYPYQNLYLFLTLQAPDGKYHRDTLDCVLADKSGKWLGKGFGDVWSHKIPFKKGVKFKQTGDFKLKVEQAMRKEELQGIMDVGLKIEKVQNKPSKETLKKLK